MSIQNEADRIKLLEEFEDIVKICEQKIIDNPSYGQTQEFENYKKRMTKIMVLIEGCGCEGRGAQLRSMFNSLAKGNIGVAKTFAPLVFKSFKNDFKKIIRKIL